MSIGRLGQLALLWEMVVETFTKAFTLPTPRSWPHRFNSTNIRFPSRTPYDSSDIDEEDLSETVPMERPEP